MTRIMRAGGTSPDSPFSDLDIASRQGQIHAELESAGQATVAPADVRGSAPGLFGPD